MIRSQGQRLVLSLICVFGLFSSFGFAQENPDKEGAETPLIQKAGENKIKLSFSNQIWVPIIEHFAEETGYSLQKIDEPPPGTFNYQSDKEFTPMEALDLINTALVREGFILIRYKQMLILRPIDDIPDQLIEEIMPDDLDERGRFEVLRCVFDLEGLEETEVDDDIERIVNPDYKDDFQYIVAAKKLYVKESVDRLKTIRKLIDETRQKSLDANTVYKIYKMKHVAPEDLLVIARQFIGMEPDANQLPDGSLKIALQPLGDKLYLSGTRKRIDQFLQTAELVDVAEDEEDGIVIEKPYIKTYQVLSMPQIVYRVCQTVLEGRDSVKMEQDEERGTIVVQGRKEDHALVEETIAEMSDPSPGFAFVNVKEADADVVAEKLRALFGQSLLEEGGAKGPTIYTDAELNQILIRGTPQEVNLAKQMIEKMDVRDNYITGPRTRERFIEMDMDDQADILDLLPEVWGSGGRENRLQIVMPEERLIPGRKVNSLPILERPGQQIRKGLGLPAEGASRKDPVLPEKAAPVEPKKSKPPQFERSSRKSSFFRANPIANPVVAFSGLLYVEDKIETGKKQETSEETGEKERDRSYRPPTQVQSVPNAPIKVLSGKYGIKLVSDDLDALDDLEMLIKKRLDREGEVQRPSVILLEHVPVEDALARLKGVLGMEDGGGGGGGAGGLGGMMGRVASNAVGGAAGDLLGGLLGGGGGALGGDSASIELEGDVRFSMDIRQNALFVSGATENDLEFIKELINFIDREDAPQNIDMLGKTYDIPIQYRDPNEVKEIVEAVLADVLDKNSAGGGGQNPQAAMQMQMARQMQNLLGGGNKSAGSRDPEKEKPKAKIVVDERRRALVLTGPKYIYEKVMEVVKAVDQEDLSKPTFSMINLSGEGDAEEFARTLKSMLGDKAVILNDVESSNGSNSNSTNARSNSTRSSSPTPVGIPGDFMRMIQSRQNGQRGRDGNTGRGRGGNTGRGGSTRGGGGTRGGGSTRGGGGRGR